MKRLLTTILLAGLGFGIFSQTNDSIQNKILNEIDSTRVLNKCDIEKYFRRGQFSADEGEYKICEYDLNGNGKSDLIACFKVIKNKELKEDCKPKNTAPYATLVMVDPNEDGECEDIYMDIYDKQGKENSDGVLETKQGK